MKIALGAPSIKRIFLIDLVYYCRFDNIEMDIGDRNDKLQGIIGVFCSAISGWLISQRLASADKQDAHAVFCLFK